MDRLFCDLYGLSNAETAAVEDFFRDGTLTEEEEGKALLRAMEEADINSRVSLAQVREILKPPAEIVMSARPKVSWTLANHQISRLPATHNLPRRFLWRGQFVQGNALLPGFMRHTFQLRIELAPGFGVSFRMTLSETLRMTLGEALCQAFRSCFGERIGLLFFPLLSPLFSFFKGPEYHVDTSLRGYGDRRVDHRSNIYQTRCFIQIRRPLPLPLLHPIG